MLCPPLWRLKFCVTISFKTHKIICYILKTTFLTFFCFFATVHQFCQKEILKACTVFWVMRTSPVMCHAYDKKFRHKTTTKVVIKMISAQHSSNNGKN